MRITYFTFIICLLLGFTIHAQVDDVSDDKFEMSIEGNTLKIPYYSNYDLSSSNAEVDKAVIVVHGANRDADVYYANMVDAASKRPILTENMVIVAPQFLTETDIDVWSLDDEHSYWTSGGWRSGSNSRDENTNPRPARIPSFAVLDSLILHLGQNFPNLESIVFTGHSAGGQVTNRMAATSPITDIMCSDYDIQMKFVVLNPSSYVYMDNQRRVSGTLDEFEVPSTNCTGFNEWKFGLEDLFTYPNRAGVDSIRNMLKRRVVTYLMGEADNDPNHSNLDNSCEAKLQGSHRFERGMIYFNYLKHYYGEGITDLQDFVGVPGVGHSNFDMYNSVEGLNALFQQPFTSCDQSVSVVENRKFWKQSIYPNPASETISFLHPELLSQSARFSILDFQGKMVRDQVVLRNNSIDISFLQAGIYLLALRQQGNRIIYVRFVVND